MPDAGILGGFRLTDNSTPDAKLQTIVTPGKVDNAATTATTNNIASAIMARDVNGDVIVRLLSITGTPVSANDAVHKGYVDSLVGGFDWKESVRFATTVNLAATRAANVLTASANGVFAAVDGITPVAGNRILVKNQTTGADNGIYTVTNVGSAGTPFVLTRATDFDTTAKVTAGATTFASEGTTLSNTHWTVYTADPIVLNTTALTFTQTAGAGSVTAGAGLTQSGNIINVIAGDATITVNADDIRVAVGGITNTHINAAAAIAWAKLDKTGSSLADLTTRSAADLSSGTLADLRLSSNVPLKNAANIFTASQKSRGATGATAVWTTDVTADTQDRFQILADGKQQWGSGAAVQDTNLYRSAADTLKTDDALIVVGLLTAGSGATVLTNAAGQILNTATTAVSTATASAIITRDAAGRAAVADPAAAGDIANMGWVQANRIDNETPTGTINGTNPTFGLANTPAAGTLHLKINGIDLVATVHYNITAATITFVSPFQPQTGEYLRADYRKA